MAAAKLDALGADRYICGAASATGISPLSWMSIRVYSDNKIMYVFGDGTDSSYGAATNTKRWLGSVARVWAWDSALDSVARAAYEALLIAAYAV